MNYVGALAQTSNATVEIGGRSFDELAGHLDTWTAVMEASRHARYVAVNRTRMDRGLRFNYNLIFTSPDRSLPAAGRVER